MISVMQTTQEKNQSGGILGLIERIGNKIPDITILFIGAFVLCGILKVAGFVAAGYRVWHYRFCCYAQPHHYFSFG